MEAFNEGKPPSVAQIKELLAHRHGSHPDDFRAGFLGDAELDGHHVVPLKELKEMIARKRYEAEFSSLTPAQRADVNAEFERIKDLMPGFPMDKALHREYHSILRGLIKSGDPPTDVDAYANKVRESLQELQRRHPGDGSFDYTTLAREADRWLRMSNIELLPPL
ncbi:MAG: hypothetical protein SFY69_00880 [Planctomycetota bacterium]|nr:hypothetical protein [Planctomycetota bacterium]